MIAMSSKNPPQRVSPASGDASRHVAVSRLGSQEDERAAATDWRGITLVHRGSELGVVGRVSREGAGTKPVLHAFGGVSRSLEYAVPESAIVAVFGVSARALVNDIVEFEPQHLCGDGRVILVPRTPRGDTEPEREGWRRRPQAAWVGVRVYADDGYLGEVEGTVPADGPLPAAALIVRARTRFWRTRFPVIPVSRVVACTPSERVARVAGTRPELLSMSQRVPVDR